jgi:bifunctional UDP-N-acetylglucosamine pyrophosphorylase/glucosamine-1-phosphate N-acetyltransferase
MNNKPHFSALILAAGEGTRMKSHLAKVLHKICGKPMVRYVVDSARRVDPDKIVLVVGYQADSIKNEFKGENIEFVLQNEQLGTAHAVMQARGILEGFGGTIMVLTGDTPLLNFETLRLFLHFHRVNNNSATVLSTVMENPAGYGRIIHNDSDGLEKIVEHREANKKELEIKEINSGIFCFESEYLFQALEKVNRENAQGEYYLTDVIAVLNNEGEKTGVFLCENRVEVIGINSSDQLDEAERLMLNG